MTKMTFGDLHNAIADNDQHRFDRALAAGVHRGPFARNQTPLHIACLHGRYKMAEKLLEEGADANAINVAGHTPAILLTSYAWKSSDADTLEFFKLLATHKADFSLGHFKDNYSIETVLSRLKFIHKKTRAFIKTCLASQPRRPEAKPQAGQLTA